MEEAKGLLSSVTFWGIALSIVGKIAYIKGYDLGDTGGLAEAIASFVGDGLALWGRIRATKRIGT
jgi:hypothetical protein